MTAARRQRLLSLLAGAVLASGLAVPVTLAHSAVARALNVTVAPDETTASADAEAQGTPVEALSDRTVDGQVFANPDGTFTYDQAAGAQRVQNADGSWTGVDPTLAFRSDGTVAPAATPAGVVLSGGGTGPMLTVSQSSGSLSLSWPGITLPAPTLSGATATYASVLAGVDLDLTATTDGVMETLVVHDAAAAANPALSSLTFTYSAPGLTLNADADGGATATDAGGNAVLDVPEAQMWDSAGGDASATLPGRSSSINPLPLALSHSVPPVGAPMSTSVPPALSISPSTSMLASPSTVFPVYIDPQVTVHGASSWLDVGRNNGGGSWGDWEPQNTQFGGLRVGASCPDDGFGNCVSSSRTEYRTFLNFAVPHQIWGSQRVSATLFTNEKWSWSCVKTTAELWQTDHASRGAVWPGPTERVWQDGQNVAYGNNSSCSAHGVSFNATRAAQSAAGGSWSNLTLELRAYINDETGWNVNSWKRFEVSANNTPFLQIVYDHQPNTPSNLTTLDGTRSAGCGSGVWISTNAPSLQARITDPDNQNVSAHFSYVRSGGSSVSLPATTALGGGGPFTKPVSGLTDGSYSWNVYGNDGTLSGPPASCSFNVDTSAPATPTITSANYTSGVGKNPVGTVGTFTFSDPGNKDPMDGVNDVVGYRYGFTNAPLNYVAASSEGGPATVPISPVWLGSRTLYVQAVDRAGNLSPDTAASPPAEFTVVTIRSTTNPTPLLAEWTLGEGSGTTAADATGNGHDAALGAQAGWGPGRVSGTSALSLTGAPDSEAFTAAQLPPVDNTGSFTVSAWVKLSPACASAPSTCGFYDAVSMDGTTDTAFGLEYVDQTWCQPGAGNGVNGCWAFTMSGSDTTNAPASTVEAATPVAFGAWVHLTGVFDQVHQTIQIYVNGQAAGAYGPATGVQPWAAPAMGPLRIGRVVFNGFAFNWWPGEISDVCTFWGALDATQVQNVYNSGCASAGAP